MTSTSTHAEINLACDACRVKKLKCSKERPICNACRHHGRVCNYSGKVARSPLTRVYLTNVERRLSQIENLFSELLPDVNVDEALASAGDVVGGSQMVPAELPPSTPQIPKASRKTPERTEDSISEAVPEEADGFDWQEDVDELADGMASLSVEPKGAGYLGSTAGVFFLRSLLFWLGHAKSTSDPQQRLGNSPDYSRMEPSSRVSRSIESRQVVNQLMDSYFSVYHRSYPFIHEATFRAQYHEVIPRPRHRSWDMLVNTVLALGAWCLGDSQRDVDEELYHRAISFVEDESLFESANLTFVQALVLLSNLSQKRNKPNTGSNFLGLATRMALSLGLHRELPDWEINALQREMRRRVWWGLYIFDSGASTTFGRPILLPDQEAMDVQPVLNIPDEALTMRTTTLPTESREPTLYSGLKWQGDFHVHSNHVSNRLLSSTGISAEEAAAMDSGLDAWSQRLPSYFQINQVISCNDPAILFARCRLWWRFWNLKIILFRQILLKRAVERSKRGVLASSSEADIRSSITAVNAASATVSSIQSFSQSGMSTRLVTWYSIYFLFHASLVIALAILGDAESSEFGRWQSELDTVRTVFRVTYADNPLAQRCADILEVIVPSQPADPAAWNNVELDPNLIDFSAWPQDGGEFFGLFGWPDPGPGV